MIITRSIVELCNTIDNIDYVTRVMQSILSMVILNIWYTAVYIYMYMYVKLELCCFVHSQVVYLTWREL